MTMGEKIKDNLTGEVFEVKKIVRERGLSTDETSYRQCQMGLNSLKFLCEEALENFHKVGVRL